MAEHSAPAHPQDRPVEAQYIAAERASTVATHRRGAGQRYYTYRPRPEARM